MAKKILHKILYKVKRIFIKIKEILEESTIQFYSFDKLKIGNLHIAIHKWKASEPPRNAVSIWFFIALITIYY